MTDKKDIKRIGIKEFRESGYLQELNRQFLHPLGLALEVEVDKDGAEQLGGIWDYRGDKEGIYYNLKESNEERLTKFSKNAQFIETERSARSGFRKFLFDSIIEPINK